MGLLTRKNLSVTAAKPPSAIARAAARFRARRAPVRLGLIIDATASRQHAWEHAQAIQMRMFKSMSGVRNLSLRLIHFGGDDLIDHGWQTDPRKLATKMAAVRCVRGLTQILPAFERFIAEEAEPKSDAIILVGDSFEEDDARAVRVCRLLAGQRTRVFTFLEGDDDWIADNAFRRIAELTDGKFARFGEELPLGDLCEGVALLSAGGRAVSKIGNKKVKQLLLAPPGGRAGC